MIATRRSPGHPVFKVSSLLADFLGQMGSCGCDNVTESFDPIERSVLCDPRTPLDRSYLLKLEGAHTMAYALVLVFEGVGEKEYWAVNTRLGLKKDGSGDWPAGLISHVGGPTPKGLLVSEIWQSKSAQEAFMASRLGPALMAEKVAPPAQVIETTPANSFPKLP